jgi:hypothetical protein
MPNQILIDLKVSQPTFEMLERFAADEDRSAEAVLEDSIRLYAERVEAFRRMGEAMERMRAEAARNGTSTMTMDEIDAEIAAVRAERGNRLNTIECSS